MAGVSCSDEAVSLFTLSVEVLLTVGVCEVELRRTSVFCELACLLSRLIVCGEYPQKSLLCE